MNKKLIAALLASLTLASPALLDFLEKWEGGADGMIVFADTLANGLPTTCYGLTRHVTDTPIMVGEYWPKEKCDRVYEKAIKEVQLDLLQCMSFAPPQTVFDGLSSLAWNVGYFKACNSQSAKHAKRGNYKQACNLLATTFSGKPNWSYASGQFIPGLQNRRIDNRDNLCLAGVYE